MDAFAEQLVSFVGSMVHNFGGLLVGNCFCYDVAASQIRKSMCDCLDQFVLIVVGSTPITV